MADEERFDSFYLATRRDLVHQTFALTGDLPAAQGAVRDAYVAAWHHWRKVSRLDDPLRWVRPHAWSLAQRRHSARLWHRGKGVSEEARAVLDALGTLSPSQRRVLLLTQLTGLSLADAARETSLTQEATGRELQAASAGFAVALDTDSVMVRSHLLALQDATEQVMLPRPPIIRRAGRKRRQVHTVLATAGAAVLAVASGAFAYQPAAETGVRATPSASVPSASAPSTDPPAEADATETATTDVLLPSEEDLLDEEQISRLGPGTWRVVDTHDNTSGNGINSVCQTDRFADPDGIAALVRTFEAGSKPQRRAVQTVEVSRSPEQAERAYETTLGWYAGCHVARLQLLNSYAIDGVGDEARAMVLRAWREPVTTYSVAVARVGHLVTSTVTSTVGTDAPKPGQVAQSLADAVAMLCASTGADLCRKSPDVMPAAPPPSGAEPGLLAVVDLPPVAGIAQPWVGTAGEPAATICDRVGFRKAGAQRVRTRTFLIPGARLPSRFGLTETYGTFRSPRAADRFVDKVRDRVAGCEDRNLAAEVRNPRAVHLSDPRLHAFIWDVETEISDRQSVMFRTAIVRAGDAVAQVTFSPGPEHDMTTGEFRDLVVRAGNRLRELD